MPENLIDIENLKKNSRFRIGTFSVPMGEGTLPGRRNPADLYDLLGIDAVEGRVISILCESGGLLTEGLRRGAHQVLGFESRYWSIESLELVWESHPQGKSHIGVGKMLPFEFEEGEGPWANGGTEAAVVFMTEGWQNYCRYPVRLLSSAWRLTQPGGRLVIELVEGRDREPSEPTNAWFPSMTEFKKCLRKILGVDSFEIFDGKLDGRFICCLRKPVATIDAIESEEDVIIVEDDISDDVPPKEEPKSKKSKTKKVKDPKAVERGKKAWETRKKREAEKAAAASKQQE